MIIIPKLRFPEFTNNWHETLLSELFTFKNGLNADKSQYGSGIKYISVSDIIDNRYITYENIKSSVQANENEITKNIVKFGDVLFQRSSETREEVGQVNIYVSDEKVVFGGFVIRGSAKVPYNPYFMNYLLRTRLVRKDITNRSGGSTRYNIGQESLNEVRTFVPTISEQQKVADFLSLVDDRIFKIDKKAKLLQEYKKGVMQKIFTQKIRLKNVGGSLYPEWIDQKLDDIITKSSTKNRGTRHLLVQSVSNSKGFVDQTEMFKDHVVASKDLSNYYVIQKGAFAYNPSRIDVGSLAYKSDSIVSVVSPLYVCFYAKNDLVIDNFLLSWFDSKEFIKQMNNSFEGSVRNTLSYDSLKRMKVTLPSLEEQKEITAFLTAIDYKINSEQSELSALKNFKKSLLQRMFI